MPSFATSKTEWLGSEVALRIPELSGSGLDTRGIGKQLFFERNPSTPWKHHQKMLLENSHATLVCRRTEHYQCQNPNEIALVLVENHFTLP